VQHEFLYLPPVPQEVNDGMLQQLLKIENDSSRHSFAGQQSGRIHLALHFRQPAIHGILIVTVAGTKPLFQSRLFHPKHKQVKKKGQQQSQRQDGHRVMIQTKTKNVRISMFTN